MDDSPVSGIYGMVGLMTAEQHLVASVDYDSG